MSLEYKELEMNDILTRELEENVDYGSESNKKFYTRINTSPIAISIKKWIESKKRNIPKEVKLYNSYNVWIVPHRVSVFSRQGNPDIRSIGIEIEYITKGETCSIISLIPSFQYIEQGSIKASIGANATFRADMELPGLLSSIEEEEGNEVEAENKNGLTLGLYTDLRAKIRLSAIAVSPIIAAVGIGASKCEWKIDKHNEPLFGRDIETWSIIVIPKNKKTISYKMRVSVTEKTWYLLDTRRQTNFETINCLVE
jgi:hypothetical protein